MTFPTERSALDGFPPAMRQNWMAELGEKLVDCGYPIIPIWPGAKCPGRYRGARHGWQGYPDWQRHCDRKTQPFELAVWKNWPGCGVGIACGLVGGLDLDILEPELAAELEALARGELGDTPAIRIGRAPKRLLLYRQAKPFAKMPRHPLEWLGRGSQFVAYGIHPDTREPYRWPFEELHEIRLDRLPVVTEEQARAFLDKAMQLIPADLKVSRLGPDRSAEFYFARGGELEGTPEATAEAVGHIPNDDLPYDDWIKIGLAVKGSAGEEGWRVFDSWSQQSSKYDAKTTEKAWRSFKPTRIGFGSLQYYAAQHGWSPDLSLTFNARKAEAMHTVDLSGLIAKAEAKMAELKNRPNGHVPPHDPETGEVIEPVAPSPTAAAHPGGVIGALVEWIVGTSAQPHPNLAVQAAVALMGMLAAHKYRLLHGQQDTRTNAMMIGIAESSSGKDHARRCVKAILDKIGMAEFYGEGFASGQAIEAAFVRRAARLYMVDEFGLTVEAALARNGNPNLKKVVDTITRLATSAAGMFKPADRAEARDVDREVPLTWDPCLTMIATTVEEPLWRALSSGNVSDGSLARYLITRTETFPDLRLGVEHFETRLDAMADLVLPVLVGPGADPTPVAVAAAVGALRAPLESDGARQVRVDPPKPSPFAVPMSKAASARLDELLIEQLKLQRAHHARHTHGIVGRLKEHVARLALIAGISANPKHPRVELDHVAWGEQLARASINIMLEAAEAHIADSDHQRNRNGVLTDLVKLGGPKGVWVRSRDLTRHGATARKLDDEQRKKCLRDLLEMDLIEVGEDKSVGRPVTLYKVMK